MEEEGSGGGGGGELEEEAGVELPAMAWLVALPTTLGGGWLTVPRRVLLVGSCELEAC